MKQTNEVKEVEEVDDVPPSPLLKVQRGNRYGSIEGLDDEELADPEELERQVFIEQWGPILSLPEPKRHDGIRPAIDESGRLDWGAFGTVDFDRCRPAFDKARYKAEKLREEYRHVLLMYGIAKHHVPAIARGRVLPHLESGVIELDDITGEDMRALARLYLRALRLQKDIRELRELSRLRREQRAEKWLQSL